MKPANFLLQPVYFLLSFPTNLISMKSILPLLFCSIAYLTFSQPAKPTPPVNPTLASQFEGLKYRNIGPSRGGRSTAVAGIPSKPNTFFMGTTGGGVWKTDDAGTSWSVISDGFFRVGSIGSIRVAPSDPNVIYVGTGSADPRGNVSIGKGMYKSTDAGTSWSPVGLEKGGQIGRIEIHPQNPDQVFAAVLGNPFGANSERGVYRSKDGGKNWEKVLFVNDKTGAMDLVMDPNNPRILFAGMWQVQRKPWTLIDGGPDGGVYQSKDGGDSWTKLESGLPTGILGKIGIAISPANSQRVWVLVETPEDAKGGLYRSDDGGKAFTRISGDRELRTRHWYYTHVFADPKDEETVYVNNVNFWKSTDGGKNFNRIRVPHGDNHDLWINPDNTKVMIHSNDGGACITLNGGETWSTEFNQPTAEFYRVEVDNAFPYRVYGSQQDNSSISVTSAPRGGSSPLMDWITWGGESGHVAVDPKDPSVIYSGNYTGELYRYDQKNGHHRIVTHYPQLHDGLPLYEVKYRYQWNAPLTFSPHDPKVLYHCSQYVHKTLDGGQTWTVISPDLTLNKKEYQEIPGGPVQHDYTGVENYNTIFAFEESPLEPGVLWAGSDDGLVHISLDAGKNWKNVTPAGLPPLATVNSIDLSQFKKGKAFVTVQNYRLNDFKPYVFKTEDYGKTWMSITSGIPLDFTTRVVRENPLREGMLFCGTEFGMYLSLDDGKSWNEFQLNLPRVPITDLLFKNNDLVIATQGRAFWILDDLSPINQWKAEVAQSKVTLFAPQKAYRSQHYGFGGNSAPEPAPRGVNSFVYLKDKPDTSKVLRVEFLTETGTVLKVFSTKADVAKHEQKLEVKTGLNKINWDLAQPNPEVTEGAVMSYGNPESPTVPTGKYQIKLSYDNAVQTQFFEVDKDPRWTATNDDLQAQYDLAQKVVDEFNATHKVIRKIRSAKSQIALLLDRAKKAGKEASIKKQADELTKKLTAVENKLIQTKNKAGQDPINYPPKFDEQLNYLLATINGQDAKPTQGCYDLYNDLKKISDIYQTEAKSLFDNEIKSFNELILKEGLGGILTEGIK
jgi:photosystem II stability/assembly factor-like uncharacterized protein